MPNAFQTGDIVEITIAFVALPVWGGRYIMVPQLRALTLLDTKIHLVSSSCSDNLPCNLISLYIQINNQIEKQVITCRHLGQLKRKPFYTTVKETAGKMAKMQIDGN
jgi:hypothetical protein